MKIFINNKETEIKSDISVYDFIENFDKNKFFVIELNGEILTKDRHKTTLLKKGDKLEVFEITGGG